jgi:glycosyltransferase involved in cell wall biosynthesis
MRLLINTAKLRFGGAVQVALSFLYECRSIVGNEYHVVLGPGVGAVLDNADFPDNFFFYHVDFGEINIFTVSKIQRVMSNIEKLINPDCVFTTSGAPFWRSRVPHLIGFNRPLFIYPESPYVKALSVWKLMRLHAQRWVHCRSFRHDADALIVQTEDVNQRVRKLLGTDKVYTVTNNHNGWYDAPAVKPARLPPKGTDTFRFLTLTSYYPHKNLEILPQLIQSLPNPLQSRLEFILTLSADQFRQKISLNIPKQIQLVGPVPPPDCPSLYMECDAMFLPTLAECFSASYPEAMKMNHPIITTDLGFARSICGEAALYFKPSDPMDAARQVERLVTDVALQESLRLLGRERLALFDSPARRAQKILEICGGLVANE